MPTIFGFVIFLPLPLVMIGAAINFIKYENCRKKTPVTRRLLADLMGPFSLLVNGAEPCECRKFLIKGYVFAIVGFAYSAILIAFF